MTNLGNRVFLIVVFYFFSTILSSCGLIEPGSRPSTLDLEENTDPPCAYFYFLWGSHAENEQKYEEALEAYEKAAICDPGADYISEKIPFLLIKLNRLEEATSWLEDYLREHPDKSVHRFLLARLKIQTGANSEAIELYSEALRQDPGNKNIQLRLGLLYSEEKQFDRAKTIFKTLLVENPDLYFANLYLARLLSQTEKNDEAALYYARALTINWSIELTYEIANFYITIENYEQSLELYTSILDHDPEEDKAALGVIQSLLYLKRHKEALEKLESYRDNSEEPHKIDLIIAQILINNNAYSEAEQLLAPLLVEHPSSELYYLLGVTLYEQKKYTETLETLQHISPGSEEYEYAIYLQVKIHRKAEQPEEAIALLEGVIGSSESKSPIFYLYLATLYQDKKDINKALETLAKGISLFPLNERLHYEYANLLDKTGQSEAAVSIMQKLIEIQPDHADALNFIGYYWADNNKNLNEALQLIQRAASLKPQSGYIRDSLGWVYYRLGEFDKAIIELEKALRLEPDDPYIYDHLGDSYKAVSDKEKALETYRKAIDMFEVNEKKKAIQDKIDALLEKQ